MAINTKVIKGRIKSIKNTKKITRAMQMVSAAKMRRAVEAALNTRTYATMVNDLLTNLAESENIAHPLLEERPVKNILVLTISSNRGLCGSFNSSVAQKLTSFYESITEAYSGVSITDFENNEPADKPGIDIIAIGKKAAEASRRIGLPVTALYEKMAENPTYEEVMPITKMITDGFLSKKYDQVFVIYTNYVSALSQTTEARQILPVSQEVAQQMIDSAGQDSDNVDVEVPTFQNREYLLEPMRSSVLSYVIPRVLEMQVYQSILESAASEHSSRMIAMKSASDAAGDLIDDLTLEFNKARQAAITQEISEIVGGAGALN
ncbi:ATP synthase F1 subunit gamma [Candidatus Dojkabacteria bacterium]|uniref:ATP synthase gamma chain n=1 Tax=Candidatus Dojkabacteria bacterium TaxID=2099670 RepID=A0A955RL06_9BACT|nr:ATP synthase F1 subunit gamma [Candidatus Dojkabacteria bacterium]